ncbi:hypothetical protein ABW21_db0204764 [Orbilia brochopaga]|nr:hypothetical protein ABW21_db0204764 [Drechslerella brochopaga]
MRLTPSIQEMSVTTSVLMVCASHVACPQPTLRCWLAEFPNQGTRIRARTSDRQTPTVKRSNLSHPRRLEHKHVCPPLGVPAPANGFVFISRGPSPLKGPCGPAHHTHSSHN